MQALMFLISFLETGSINCILYDIIYIILYAKKIFPLEHTLDDVVRTFVVTLVYKLRFKSTHTEK